MRAAYLERENAALRQEVAEIRKELGRCRTILSKYENRLADQWWRRAAKSGGGEIKDGLNLRLWIFGVARWTEWSQENGDDDEEADDYDDECIRQGEGLCNEAQVSFCWGVSS